jgi:hypothetical protein
MRQLAGEGMTMIVVTHEMSFARGRRRIASSSWTKGTIIEERHRRRHLHRTAPRSHAGLSQAVAGGGKFIGQMGNMRLLGYGIYQGQANRSARAKLLFIAFVSGGF